MATKIIHKKSSVVGKVPLATDLEIGELAINLADKKLFSKDSGGNVVEITTGATNLDGLTDVTISTPSAGQLLNYNGSVWVNTSTPSNLDSVAFDTTSTEAGGVGKFVWNDGDGTLDLGLKGGNVTLQLGQEQVVLVKNATGSNLTEGQVVYINGAQGQRPTIALASADTETSSSKTFGVLTENIANGAEGFVTISGLVRDINTLAYAEGATLWLSTTAGQFTTTKPTGATHLVHVGWVVRSHETSGSILVHVQNGFELYELHDVVIETPTNDQVLTYEASTGLWKNKTVSGGGGATNLDGLTDVTITSPTTGQVLKYNGTTWVNDTDATGAPSVGKTIAFSIVFGYG